MNGFALQQPWVLLALALAPALAILFHRARRKRESLLRAYGGQRSMEILAHSRERRQTEWCVVTATVLLALALARPGANPRPRSSPEGGRDVIFVLDVSRSMLGDDVRPSRLERAKADIARCLASLGNDRVGLVLFAGAAAIRCPLTTDYGFFRQMLKDAAPDSMPRGSTYLELGLEKTVDRMLATNHAGFEDVILLTDGGDQGSHPERTIAALNGAGARLLVVGYGDPKIGARVPGGEGDTNGFLVYEGQEVWTKLDEADLQKLAGAATKGKYVHGGTPDFDLGQTYAEWTANAPRKFLPGRSDLKYDEYFGWLLVPALALLLYPFTGLRRRKTILLLLLFTIRPLHATAATNEPEQASAADTTAGNLVRSGEPPFQLGVSLMHKQSFKDAAKAFQSAADRAATAEEAAVCRYNEALAEAALAKQSPDPQAQLDSLGAAITAMRRVRLLRPDWLPATQGLEVLYARHADAVEALKAQQDEQNKLNRQAAEFQKELERLLTEQKKLLAAGTQLQRDRVTPDAEKDGMLEDVARPAGRAWTANRKGAGQNKFRPGRHARVNSQDKYEHQPGAPRRQ